MDILKDKQTKSYDYISRYAGIPFYYNIKDNKYIYGLTKQLDDTTNYVIHNVIPTDNLDYLSNYYYGRPDYYWVIAEFNYIQDPFIKLSEHFDIIKIPAINEINYKD